MEQKIAMLRGINVGGKRKIVMADLKELFVKMGFTEVLTYIQSGNVLFKSNSEDKNTKLEDTIEKSIAERYEFDVPVIIRTADELEDSLLQNPFAIKNEIERCHITFLKIFPKKENIEKIKAYNFDSDEFVIYKKDIFVYYSGKYHISKLSNNFFESKLKVGATTRNWKTMLKLSELPRYL